MTTKLERLLDPLRPQGTTTTKEIAEDLHMDVKRVEGYTWAAIGPTNRRADGNIYLLEREAQQLKTYIRNTDKSKHKEKAANDLLTQNAMTLSQLTDELRMKPDEVVDLLKRSDTPFFDIEEQVHMKAEYLGKLRKYRQHHPHDLQPIETFHLNRELVLTTKEEWLPMAVVASALDLSVELIIGHIRTGDGLFDVVVRDGKALISTESAREGLARMKRQGAL